MSTMAIILKAIEPMQDRGIVYDVGLRFSPSTLSVDKFNPGVVAYDMKIISDSLHCNAVRIEGEDIDRLVHASVTAHINGLKVFFNPWLMEGSANDVVSYMGKAAKAAEALRQKGIDITFVTGCEFSLFNPGIFEGKNVNERINTLSALAQLKDSITLNEKIEEYSIKLNDVLYRIVNKVRGYFHGPVTYSAGTWEPVDWSIFDAVGIDYYRDLQSDKEYLDGLERYFKIGKPLYVMEVGCCAFEGAAELGSTGYTICMGTDKKGNGIYLEGKVPIRNEKVQADYAEKQIRLLNESGVNGMFIFEFSFPIAPYREKGHDADMTAYPIVKSYPPEDLRSKLLPPWEPKEAFHRISKVYKELKN